jgi:hypothetical protein
VLDILVQPRRDRRAAKKFFRNLLRRLRYVPRAIVTDKLGSYAAAKAQVLRDVLHIQGSERIIGRRIHTSQRGSANVECEASSRPGTPSVSSQRSESFASFFLPGRHLLAARNYREVMRRRFAQWNEVIHPSFVGQRLSSGSRRAFAKFSSRELLTLNLTIPARQPQCAQISAAIARMIENTATAEDAHGNRFDPA